MAEGQQEGPKRVVTESYHPNGALKSRSVYFGPAMHNENGPSYLAYYDTGQERTRWYTRLGNYHNESGPAIVEKNKDGAVRACHFYVDGVRLTKEEFLARHISEPARA